MSFSYRLQFLQPTLLHICLQSVLLSLQPFFIVILDLFVDVISTGGYSVLGWNHPGFGGSTVSSRCFCFWNLMWSSSSISLQSEQRQHHLLEWVAVNVDHHWLPCCLTVVVWPLLSDCLSQGVPFPQNEANAMDVVIQFAVHKLGFQLSDIVIFAWSIGGFTGTTSATQTFHSLHWNSVLWFGSNDLPFSATWAAMSYPEVQALVLDASFDDLLPLALKVMPDSWSECLSVQLFIYSVHWCFVKHHCCRYNCNPSVLHQGRWCSTQSDSMWIWTTQSSSSSEWAEV